MVVSGCVVTTLLSHSNDIVTVVVTYISLCHTSYTSHNTLLLTNGVQ